MKKATSTRPSLAPKHAETGKAGSLIAAEAEIKTLKEELADLELLYEGTIEHGEAVEDQLAGPTASSRGFREACQIPLAPDLQLDLHRASSGRDLIEAQEAHHLLLRYRRFHADDRQPRIRKS